MQEFGYEDTNTCSKFPTALLAITQLAALKISGKLADCQEPFGDCVMPCIAYICSQSDLSLGAGCAADIPDGISGLGQLTSLEYWSQVTCPPPQLSCLQALKTLAVNRLGEYDGVNDAWIEGIACLPSLKQLHYGRCVRWPSEFFALQLTSLKLDFDFDKDLDDELVEKVCAPASATCSLAVPAQGNKKTFASLLTTGQDLTELYLGPSAQIPCRTLAGCWEGSRLWNGRTRT